MEKIKIVLASEGAQMPRKASNGAAGYDLYTCEDVIIRKGRQIVPTGLKIAIPYGWEGHIRPRSGYSAKGIEGYGVVNGKGCFDYPPKRYDADSLHGTIDSDYTGIVGLIINSHSDAPFCIKKGSRLAQIVFEQCYMGELEQVDEIDETERGDGGYGHSGV